MALLAGALLGLLAAGLWLSSLWSSLPDPRALLHLAGDGTVVLRYADGSPLAVTGRRPGPFLQPREVSESIRQGFLATEDKRFFQHDGVDWRGVTRALYADLSGMHREGASTITEQLVHNYYFPDAPRTLGEKVREALMAVRLERVFSKQEILQAYMTVINYGPERFGVQDAARYYFGKDADAVNLSEAAVIVGAANGSTIFNPHLHPDRSWMRARAVLDRMRDAGVIDVATHDAAYAAPPRVVDLGPAPLSQWTVARIVRTLDLRSQAEDRGTELIVPTTLDRQAQAAAEQAVLHAVGAGQDLQAVLIALDGSGAVKAYVPATRYDAGHGYADERRQIGSVMKGLIYTAAMEAGARPLDQCDDSPGVGAGDWAPRDDEPPMGRVTLKTAFAYSSNIVAVRLANELGYPAVADLARRLRMPPLPPSDRPAWPLSVEASPLEVARAFLPFSNGGQMRPVRFLDAVTDSRGRRLYDPPGGPAKPGVSAGALSKMHELMRAVVTERGATGTRAAVDGLWIGGKTGTTSRNVNTWFVGYGDNFVVTVWVGRPRDQKSLGRVYGGTVPASIFHEFVVRQQLGWGRRPPAGADPLAAPLTALGDAVVPPAPFVGQANPAAGQGCRAG